MPVFITGLPSGSSGSAGRIGELNAGTMKEVTFSDLRGATQIYNNNKVFHDCKTLEKIEIPSSVTNIEENAFYGCGGLKEMTIPFVGSEAGKTSTSTYQYPFGIIFGSNSYTGAEKVVQTYLVNPSTTPNPTTTTSSYYIPTSLKTVIVIGGNILRGAFYNCDKINNIVLPHNLITIEAYAFRGCSGLTSMTIPDSVTSIGNYAFYNCSGLTSVEIPNSVTSIGNRAFSYCSSLTSVTIGNGVTSIGEFAFAYCKSLTSFTVNALVPPTLPNKNALEATNGCPIYVPASSVNAYRNASNWSAYAKRITAIPE